MNIVLNTLSTLAVLYALVCLFYWLVQERMIFIRFRLPPHYRFRFKAGHPPHEEIFIEQPDGAKLHALLFTAPQPKGVVLYFHGNTGSLRRWGKRAPRFTKLGWSVLMPDPRGYGKSRGRLSEAALHADAEAWFEQVLKQWSRDRIVLFGRSLGSGLATPLAAKHGPRALVLESPFANLIEVARSYSVLLPYRLLLRYPFRNDRAIRRVTCPVLIFHGQRDQTVPYASALRLYALVPPNVRREMVSFPHGHHNDLPRFDLYHRKLKELLDGH